MTAASTAPTSPMTEGSAAMSPGRATGLSW